MATTTLRRPTRRCRNALAAAAAAALLIACGGGGDPGAPSTALLPPPTVSVDTALRPAVAQVAGIDGGAARALARVADEDRRYAAARKRALAALQDARPLGTKGRRTWTRDELHER